MRSGSLKPAAIRAMNIAFFILLLVASASFDFTLPLPPRLNPAFARRSVEPCDPPELTECSSPWDCPPAPPASRLGGATPIAFAYCSSISRSRACRGGRTPQSNGLGALGARPVRA